jgi:hypothetical protein
MSNLMQTGQAWLAGQLKAHVSTPVVYDRGGQTVTLDATFGRTDAERVDENGVGIREEIVDFLVTAADLVIDGAAVLPKRGDAIRYTDGAVEKTYEVMTVGEGHYRPADPFGTMLRIHTKLILTQP